MAHSILIKPILNVLQSIAQDSGFKLLWAAFVVLLGQVVFDNQMALLVLFAFIATDWLTGIWAALRQRIFSSMRFRQSLVKILVYYLIISLFHSLDYFGEIFRYLNLDTYVIAYLAIVELISILENCSKIYPQLTLPDWITSRLKVFRDTGNVNVTKTITDTSTDGGANVNVTETTTTTSTDTQEHK